MSVDDGAGGGGEVAKEAAANRSGINPTAIASRKRHSIVSLSSE